MNEQSTILEDKIKAKQSTGQQLEDSSIKQIIESVSKLKLRQELSNTSLVIGKDSFIFHITSLKNAVKIIMAQKKVGFQLTLEHLISVFKNVVTFNKKQQLSKSTIELVKLYFTGLDKTQFVTQFYGVFKNLVKANEGSSLLSNQTLTYLTDILTSSQHTDVGLLNKTVMKKICKKFGNSENTEAMND